MSTITSDDSVLETQVFWYRHRREILALIILVVLAGVAWGGYKLYTERRESIAASALSTAKTASDFQKVISQYPGTPANQSAYMFLAEEQRKEKKFSEANATLQSFIDKFPNHELKGTARLAMAGNLESMGKPDEALAIYQRLATEDPDSFVAPTALLAQVPIFKAKNQDEEARRALETIMTKYRDRYYTGEAQAKLRLLKPPPAPPQAPTPPPQTLSPEGIVKNLIPSLKMRPPPPQPT